MWWGNRINFTRSNAFLKGLFRFPRVVEFLRRQRTRPFLSHTLSPTLHFFAFLLPLSLVTVSHRFSVLVTMRRRCILRGTNKQHLGDKSRHMERGAYKIRRRKFIQSIPSTMSTEVRDGGCIERRSGSMDYYGWNQSENVPVGFDTFALSGGTGIGLLNRRWAWGLRASPNMGTGSMEANS